MNIKSIITLAAFKGHYLIEKLSPPAEIKYFLSRFREHYISCDLIRIGGESDGGYLHPDILDEISYCFSPGVEYTASFEKELSEKFNIKSFMADASVKDVPFENNNFSFIPKFLGIKTHNKFITLSDWISLSGVPSSDNKILQMDIEGAEYEVLLYEDAQTLSSFSTMTIEFHFLNKLFQRDFLKMATIVFEKIYKNFSICHVHPNNCCGISSLDGTDIPRVIEVTFIRNDIVERVRNGNAINLPHILDRKNIQKNHDITMPTDWWKHS